MFKRNIINRLESFKNTSECSNSHSKRVYFLVLILLILNAFQLFADSWVNTEYNTTEGNEFYITTMKNGPASTANSTVLKIYLYATAREETYICVDYKDQEDLILRIPGGGQNGINIPMEYIYTDESDAIQDATLSVKDTVVVTIPQDKSLYVYTCDAQGRKDTTKKVSLYLTNYYTNYGYEVTNVLPVKALEREYMVQTYSTDKAATEFVVVATEDNQTFEMSLRLNDADTIYFKTTKTFSLNKGQTRLIRTADGFNPLSGTYVCSDYKFVVYNGNQDCRITSNSSHVFEQAYSTDKWGYEYVATPTYNRASSDLVILTAIEDGTIIEKNGRQLVELQQGYSYEDQIDAAVHYKSNKKILCYLYENGETKESPAMTTITPISMGVKSIVVAAFNATAKDLALEANAAKAHREIKDHYINVVTEKAYIDYIYLGNTKVTGFKQVSNTKYYHATCKLNSAAVLKCNKENGTFTARMYGDYFPTEEDLKKNITPFSYAYSAGSRANRAVDMLINDKYIRYLRICLNKKVKFTPLIDFEYDRDNTKWIIGDDVIPFTSLGQDGIVDNYRFDTTGLYDVYLVVQSYTPLCEKTLIDTVHAQIEVDDLSYDAVAYDPCYGEEFELQYKDQQITFKADTSLQYWEGRAFRFEVGVPKIFADTIPATTEDECDLVLRQVVTVRPVYKDTFDTTACDVWHWEHEKDGKVDTVYTFRVGLGDKLPVTKEHTIRFGTRYYDCDSIVTWRVTLNKSYSIVEDSIICQDLSGQLKYIWTGHDTIDIAIDKVGTFTYVDHLKTKHEPYCDSIHTLHLTVVPSYDSTEVVTICQNESFTWSVNGKRYVGNKFDDIQSTDVVLNRLNETITFVETFETNYFGCDSIHRLEILVYPSYDTTYVVHICDDDVYKLNDTIQYYGAKYNADGLVAQEGAYKYDHFFKTQNDCDSTIHLELYVHPTYEIVQDTAVCQVKGGTFEWLNHSNFFSETLQKQVTTISIDKPGNHTYIDSQKTTKYDCDSIHILNITIHPTYFISQDTVMSNEDQIHWEDLLIAGKDAGATNPDYVVTKDTTIEVRYETISFLCDSIMQLNIKFGEVFRDTTYDNACDNDGIYKWYWDNNGTKQYLKDITVPTIVSTYEFIEKRKSSLGVDSLFYLYLTVHPTYLMETVDSICEGEQYIWKVKDANGDSVKITAPIFDKQKGQLINPLDISSILAENQTTPQTFQYTYNLKTEACTTCPDGGCDSIYVLTLTVLPQYDRIDTMTMCDNGSVNWKGEMFYGYKSGHASSIIGDTLITREYQNEHGCLSYSRLQLMVLPTYLDVAADDTAFVNICENEKYETSYGKVYNANGEWNTPDNVISRYVVIDTIKTMACDSCYGMECDSVVASVIYVYPTYEKVTYDVICQNDDYQWIVRDQNGDSINIILNNIYDKQDQLVQDIPTDKHGQFEYRYYTKTCEECTYATRCDSTHILYLTILPRANTVDTLWMCDNDSVQWTRNGKWFYGDKSQSKSATTYASKADPYEIISPANNAYGCDYQEILYLYVRPSYILDTIVHICDNQEFKLNDTISYYGNLYKSDGLVTGEYLYTNKFKTTDCKECEGNECDSIVNLTLYIHKTYNYVQVDTICKDDANNYSWEIVDPLNGDVTILSAMIRDEKNQTDISALNIPTNELGTFTYTYKTLTETCEDCPNEGCDSVWTLKLTVIDGYAIHKEIHICDNDTAVWNKQLYVGQQFTGTYDPTQYNKVKQLSRGTSSYVYNDTIFGVSKYGCDSTHFLELHVHPTYLQPVRVDTIDICDNETYLFYGTEYNTTGEWHTGKDTTQFIQLNYNDITVNDCDSAVVHILRVHPTFNAPLAYDTICHSALPYNYADHRAMKLQGLTESGIYLDTLQTINGCDSIISLHLTVNPSTINQVYVDWCYSSGPYTYDSIQTPMLRNLTQTGVYTDTLQTILNQYKCDSIIELHLTILDSIVAHLYDSVCDNELPYNHMDSQTQNLWNLTETGIYYDTLTSVNGCDSVLVLHLQVNKTYNTIDSITICASEGSPYIWRPSDINGPREIAIPFEIDDRVNVKNKQTLVLNDSSVLLQSIHGCDSLVNLCLIVHPTYELVEVDTVDCQDTINSYSTWIDQLGGEHQIDISKSGWITIAENKTTIYGCDSTIGIKLYVRPIYRYDSVYTICQDERISWQGKTYAGSHYGYNYQLLSDGKYAEHRDSVYYLYEPGDSILEVGVHHDTIVYPTILGCDSTYYLTLNVLPTSNTILDVSICDDVGEYVFETRDKNGTYYDTIPISPITEMIDSVRKDTAFYMRQRTLKTNKDCDSIVNLHLTVTPTYEYITRAEICAKEAYTWRGNDYNKAGIYYDRDTTEQGCDSTYILELFVRPVLYIPKTLHACDNQTVMHSDTLWYDQDSVRFAVENTLLWKPGMQIPNPDEYREVHYYTLDGRCDSIIYQYYLHIHPTYDSIVNKVICSNESYQLHESFTYTPIVAYHEPGSMPAVIDTLITDSLKTRTCEECAKHGCDSIFRANIRVLPAYKHIDSVTICSNEKYDWQDTVLYEPNGDSTITYFYQKSYTTDFGCDSIYEMYLTVHQAYNIEVYETICADEYYQFGTTLLNQTGEYLDTLRTIHDCDSIVHLYLTVLDTTIIITYDTICVTEKYQFFDAIYTEPGLYDTITLNELGCKQYNYLCLEVIDTTAYEIAIGDIICADDEEIIVYYERLSGKTLMEYSVLFDELGHAQGFEDIYHATLDTTLSYFSIPIPRGEVLPHPNPTYFDSQQGINEYVYEDKYAYPIPNLYRFKIIMHNGICGDSLQRKDTTVSFWYPSWIHEQHWNDGIVLYNEIYNGGYEFSKYQWFLNGDSILGATKEYLYVPNQLEMNQQGECNNYYQLALTRLEDGYTTFTCPICPVLLFDTIVPQKDYFSVVPTIVSKINPTIHILSTRPGSYKITGLMGNQKQGDFVPDANNYAGSINLDEYLLRGITNQLILVTLTLDTGEQRTIKVIVGN